MAMPTIGQMAARLVDLFGPQASADPTKLYGNLMVSPGGNILLGTTADDGVHKLQVNGTTKLGGSGLVMPDGTAMYSAKAGDNKAINGACLVAQRGSLVVTAGTGGYGGPDRYYAAMGSGTTGQFTQSQGTITYGGAARPAVLQTVNTACASFSTASFYWSGIVQKIEGYNCYDLITGQVALQFLFYTNVTGTYTVSINDSTNANAVLTTFTAMAGVVTPVRIAFPAIPSTAVIPCSGGTGMSVSIGALGGSTIVSSTLNSWITGNYIVASTATNWAAVASNFISATEIQLEAGPVNTLFKRQYASDIVVQCQRYYQVLSVLGLTGMTFTSNGDTRSGIPLLVPMRTSTLAVTCSESSLNVVGFGLSGNFTNVALGLTGFGSSSTEIRITGTNTANVTAAGSVVQWSTSDNPIFYVSGEL